MKKLIQSLMLGTVLMGTSLSVQAYTLPCQAIQADDSAKKEMPNPEKAARQMTDRMQKSLGLTDKQYKKIYKLNLKEQKTRVEQAGGQRPDGNRPPMMGGDDRPPMMGGAPGGGFPPMGGNGRPMMPPPSDNKNDLRTLMEKKEKQLKKILTDEQYAKWQSERPRPEMGGKRPAGGPKDTEIRK